MSKGKPIFWVLLAISLVVVESSVNTYISKFSNLLVENWEYVAALIAVLMVIDFFWATRKKKIHKASKNGGN